MSHSSKQQVCGILFLCVQEQSVIVHGLETALQHVDGHGRH